MLHVYGACFNTRRSTVKSLALSVLLGLSQLTLLLFSRDEVLLEKRAPTTKVIVEKLNSLRHIAQFDVKANLLVRLSNLLQCLQLVFDVHLIQQSVQLLIVQFKFLIGINTVIRFAEDVFW